MSDLHALRSKGLGGFLEVLTISWWRKAGAKWKGRRQKDGLALENGPAPEERVSVREKGRASFSVH